MAGCYVNPQKRHTKENYKTQLQKRKKRELQKRHTKENFKKNQTYQYGGGAVDRLNITHTGWRRPTKCLISTGHFPQKSPIIRGSFTKSDLQLEKK